MRLSSLQTFIGGTTRIVDLTNQLSKTQQQLSSNTRILTPADDPVASSRIVRLDQDSRIRQQFSDNITLLRTRLELEETSLNSVNNTVIRLKELTIQANNGTLTVSDRQAIASEIKVRLSELADLLNTKNASNEYLFSGFKGNTQPFVANGAGNYSYLGDEGQRLLQVASSTFVPANDSGKVIFEDVSSAQPTFRLSENPTNRAVPPAAISNGFVYDQAAFNQIYPEDFIIEFQNPDDLILLGKARAANFNIIRKSDGRVVAENMLYQSGAAIQYEGIQLSIDGTPSVGDTFFIESTDNQGLLTTVGRLIEGMENLTLSPDDQQAYQDLMSSTLTNLDNAQTSVLQVRSELGARLNTVESTASLHEEVEEISQKLLSSLRDLDYAEAVSRLSFESFVLQAAQESYARISSLSLFNSL